jgi:hypothetical protein
MWRCQLIENPPIKKTDDSYYVDYSGFSIGAMWYVRSYDTGEIPTQQELKEKWTSLSDYYWQNNSNRPPMYILVPHWYWNGQGQPLKQGNGVFSVDGKCYSKEKGEYGGWTVQGTPPNIIISPSVNIEGHYHGFIGSSDVPVGYVGNDLELASRARIAT